MKPKLCVSGTVSVSVLLFCIKQAPQTLMGQNREKPNSAKEKVAVMLQSGFSFFFYMSHIVKFLFLKSVCIYFYIQGLAKYGKK